MKNEINTSANKISEWWLRIEFFQIHKSKILKIGGRVK